MSKTMVTINTEARTSIRVWHSLEGRMNEACVERRDVAEGCLSHQSPWFHTVTKSTTLFCLFFLFLLLFFFPFLSLSLCLPLRVWLGVQLGYDDNFISRSVQSGDGVESTSFLAGQPGWPVKLPFIGPFSWATGCCSHDGGITFPFVWSQADLSLPSIIFFLVDFLNVFKFLLSCFVCSFWSDNKSKKKKKNNKGYG